MKTGLGRLGFEWGAVTLLAVSTAWGARPTISLRAVKHNDVAIEPTTTIAASPGDIIEAEIVVAGWADEVPQGVQSFAARILANQGATSGGNGLVLPLGWDAPVDSITCSSVEECPGDLLCDTICHGPLHNPYIGAYMNTARPDFIFQGFSTIADVAATVLHNYYYFGLIRDGGPALDSGEPRYIGTLILVVSEFACGTFVYEFEPCGFTYLSSPEHVDIWLEPESLTIEVDECSTLPALSLPPNCAVDARIPHTPYEAADAFGWNSIDITFDGDPWGLSASSFSMSLVPASVTPQITSVAPVGGNTLRLTWDSIIPFEHWTCVRHLESDRQMCLGNLPANADQGPETDPADVEALTTILDGMPSSPSPELFQCDLDRSTRCTPLDILCGIDLLNGAGYETWAGASLLEACPSGPITAPTVAGSTLLGSCCDTFIGICRDEVPLNECPGPRYVWDGRADCCVVTCDGRGACCDTFLGECVDNVLENECQGPRELWFRWASCANVSCIPRGGCCNWSNGICADEVLQRDCQSSSAQWFRATHCSEILCYPQ